MRYISSALQKVLHAIGWQGVRRQGGAYEILKLAKLGADHLCDIREILGRDLQTIFDVGANDGQSIRSFLPAFPKAEIFSFEPDPQTFARLLLSAQKNPRVRAVCAALGREEGNKTLFRFGLDQTNSLLPKAVGAEQFVFDSGYMGARGTVQVKMTTLDGFCRGEGISQIDLLKIDTQGYELEVLNGAKRLLDSKSIGLIYTEVCFVRYYQSQPLFQDVYEYLYAQGYRLVGLYESGYLTHYYQVGGNALFVHESLGKMRAPVRSASLGPVRISW